MTIQTAMKKLKQYNPHSHQPSNHKIARPQQNPISPTTLASISIASILLTSLAIPPTADTRDLKPIPLPRQTPPHLPLQLPGHSLVLLL